MKAISRATVGLMTTIALVSTVSTQAFAADAGSADTAPQGAAIVAEFFEDIEASSAETVKAIDAFEALSATERADIVATLESDTPEAIFTLGEPIVSTTSVPEATPLLGARVAAAAAATYEVTSNYTYPVKGLGITFGSFNLRYKYQTGSNKVLKDYSCTGFRDGISGFWSYSVTSNHWVSGGLGHCEAIFTGSLVYKGSAIAQNKEMGMIVNGPGIKSKWITAL